MSAGCSISAPCRAMFISQNDIDHILRAGGNADAARMKIAAEFSKQKPLEDRAAFLKALYYGGNGLITDNGRLSAWYSETCNFCKGCTSDSCRKSGRDDQRWQYKW